MQVQLGVLHLPRVPAGVPEGQNGLLREWLQASRFLGPICWDVLNGWIPWLEMVGNAIDPDFWMNGLLGELSIFCGPRNIGQQHLSGLISGYLQ